MSVLRELCSAVLGNHMAVSMKSFPDCFTCSDELAFAMAYRQIHSLHAAGVNTG